ncbi:hypothetical protein CSW98_12335 [Vibrio sp. HA2012]|uniref:hypothetical protein n=1 Tax=Vibrio sp. HA2012 TaxID=1971595 RepID=UPI000C2B73EE|nr:hypothetical protein [Vibrio sp. HA2012]PJC85839.1 hypothetical protein CSW98_12335 [Vibrio sp. HA2012]
MKPLLSEAYQLLLELEKFDDISLLNRASIVDEINDKNEMLWQNITSFNQQVRDLFMTKDKLSKQEFLEKLVMVRVEAMNISTEFDNFREEFDNAFLQNRDNI